MMGVGWSTARYLAAKNVKIGRPNHWGGYCRRQGLDGDNLLAALNKGFQFNDHII